MLLVSNCDLPTNRMNWNRLLISLAAKVSEWAVSVWDAYFIQAARRILVINCHWFLTSVFLLGEFLKAWKMLLYSLQHFGALEVERTRGKFWRRVWEAFSNARCAGQEWPVTGGFQEEWQLPVLILGKNMLHCVLLWVLFFLKGNNCGYRRCVFPFLTILSNLLHSQRTW